MVRAANPSIGERRSAQRTATWRKAVVVCADPATPLFTGTAVDISRDGMAIRANAKLPLGTAVDLEVEPRKDSEAGSLIRVSGHVTRCHQTEPHEYAIGVRFRVLSPLKPTPAVRPVYRMIAGATTPTPTVAKPESRRTLAPWLAILTAILLVLLWWPFGDSGVSANHRSGSTRTLELSAAYPKPELRPGQNADIDIHGELDRNKFDWEQTETGIAGDGGAGYPAESLEGLDGMGGPGGFVSFASELKGGNPGPISASEGVVRPAALGASVAASGSYLPVPPLQEAGASNAGRPRADVSKNRTRSDADTRPDRSRVHLEVSRDLFEMTVFVDGEPIKRFPVGLGRDGSTPSGRFTIHNKIVQPDWYHRGESVPYGDPRNPLGESWMGLAADGQPLSYGIHPTNELDSIGGEEGAGCIRMRPEDAATLFRLCPVGVTVNVDDES